MLRHLRKHAQRAASPWPRLEPIRHQLSTWTIPFNVVIEGIELLIYSNEGGPTLVGAIELVSPGNKDRVEARRAFATKCASYLHQGIGSGNRRCGNEPCCQSAQRNDVAARAATVPALAAATDLYAVAYRPVRRSESNEIEIWPQTLAIGKTLA